MVFLAPVAFKPVKIVVVVLWESAGGFIARVPLLPGCEATASTKEDAIERATAEARERIQREGLPLSTFVGMENVEVDWPRRD